MTTQSFAKSFFYFLFFVSLSNSSTALANQNLLYELRCHHKEDSVVLRITDTSPEYPINEGHKYPIVWAKADVTVSYNLQQTRFHENIHIFDEGQGNFRMQIFAFVGEILPVASIYFEHEGSYIDGEIWLPSKNQSNSQFEFNTFDQMLRIESWPCTDGLFSKQRARIPFYVYPLVR